VADLLPPLEQLLVVCSSCSLSIAHMLLLLPGHAGLNYVVSLTPKAEAVVEPRL
jgi:hypothetical protein